MPVLRLIARQSPLLQIAATTCGRRTGFNRPSPIVPAVFLSTSQVTMSSAQSSNAAEKPANAPGGQVNPPEKDLVPGPDGTMMSKSAAKKAFKLAEGAAKKAAKAAATEKKAPAAGGESSTKKKEKAKKEKEAEPEWINNTVPGEKKGEWLDAAGKHGSTLSWK